MLLACKNTNRLARHVTIIYIRFDRHYSTEHRIVICPTVVPLLKRIFGTALVVSDTEEPPIVKVLPQLYA